MGAGLLADENVPGPAVTALRREGHDAVWMHEEAPGTPDVEVLARAQQEERVVVTFDKDFGELAFRFGAAATFGVVLFRINAESPDAAARDTDRLVRRIRGGRGRAHPSAIACRSVTGQSSR